MDLVSVLQASCSHVVEYPLRVTWAGSRLFWREVCLARWRECETFRHPTWHLGPIWRANGYPTPDEHTSRSRGVQFEDSTSTLGSYKSTDREGEVFLSAVALVSELDRSGQGIGLVGCW